MSVEGSRARDQRRRSARPCSARDRLIRTAAVVLPMSVGVIGAVLVTAPLIKRDEASFILQKDKVATAPERMRATQATYRGTDAKGAPFALTTAEAVQATSKTQVVGMKNLTGDLTLTDGPARITAPDAEYDMAAQTVRINGALDFAGPDGYRIKTSDVHVDLNRRALESDGRVTGSTRLGTFSAGRMSADLDKRTVTLSGGARLHIVQGAVKATR
jgi:lipopolysaccharide export system protein LptC